MTWLLVLLGGGVIGAALILASRPSQRRLPQRGSEDASLLDDLVAPPAEADDSPPSSRSHFLVRATPVEALPAARVARAWQRSTARKLGRTSAWALDPDGLARPIDAVDEGSVAQLVVARSLRDLRDDDGEAFVELVAAVDALGASLPGDVLVTPDHGIADGVKLAQRLLDTVLQWDMTVEIVVAASGDGFDGREVWDVLLSLGFEWASEEHFRFRATDGHGRPLLAVWNKDTPPAFDRDVIADGSARIRRLHFGFSVPLAHRPTDLLEAVVHAAEYTRERLGGRLLDASGAPLDLDKKRRAVEVTVDALTAQGIVPGSRLARDLFDP